MSPWKNTAEPWQAWKGHCLHRVTPRGSCSIAKWSSAGDLLFLKLLLLHRTEKRGRLVSFQCMSF